METQMRHEDARQVAERLHRQRSRFLFRRHSTLRRQLINSLRQFCAQSLQKLVARNSCMLRSSSSVSAPAARSMSPGEIGWLGLLPTHECATPPWPLCSKRLRSSVKPPLMRVPAVPLALAPPNRVCSQFRSPPPPDAPGVGVPAPLGVLWPKRLPSGPRPSWFCRRVAPILPS
jgi:hypothetical protein